MDFYQALRAQGMGHRIPTKQRTSSHIQSHRAPSTLQKELIADWQRYCQTVAWPEYRGNSYKDAQKPLGRAGMKHLHEFAMERFNNLEAQLREYHRRDRW